MCDINRFWGGVKRAVWWAYIGLKNFVLWIWPPLKPAAQEIIVHFLVTILTILSLLGIEVFLEVVHLAGKEIMAKFTFSDLMFDLDLLAVVVINVVGVFKALKVVYRGGGHGG